MAKEAAAPFSPTQHMEAMFRLYMKAGAGQRLRMGTVTLNDLYAVWCAAFTEGAWTERAHPSGRRAAARHER